MAARLRTESATLRKRQLRSICPSGRVAPLARRSAQPGSPGRDPGFNSAENPAPAGRLLLRALPSPVNEVDALIRQWRDSKPEASARLQSYDRLFRQRANLLEIWLDDLAPRPVASIEEATPQMKLWRWNKVDFVFFWVVVVVLCLSAFAAGYLSAVLG